MIIETYKDIEIQAGGLVYEGVTSASANIDVNDPTIVYKIISTGTPSMGASYTVATTGTAIKGNKVTIKYEATVDFNGNTLTLMGTTIDVAYEAKKFIVESIYDGIAWNTIVSVDFDQSDIIIADSIKADAVTSTKILDNAIVSSKILDGAILPSKLDPSILPIKAINVTISSADILTGNTTPVSLVIDNAKESYILLGAVMKSDAGGTTPYATNTIIQIFQNTAQEPLFESDLLGFATGVEKRYKLASHDPIINRSQGISNKGFNMTIKTGNPTAGDSDIKILIYYMVITN